MIFVAAFSFSLTFIPNSDSADNPKIETFFERENLFEKVDFQPPGTEAYKRIFAWSEDQCLRECAAMVPGC